MMRHAVPFLVLAASFFTNVKAQDFDPKPARSEVDLSKFRSFISGDLGTPYSQGSLRRLGEPTRIVHGRAIDHQGKPIVGAQVSLSTEVGYDRSCYDENFDVTDSQGRFLLEGNMTLRRVVVRRAEGQVWQVSVKLDQKKVVVRWPEPAKCSITIPKKLRDDDRFGDRLYLRTTSYWAGMSSLTRMVSVAKQGSTVVENLIPAEYSVCIEKSIGISRSEDDQAVKSRFIEIARFHAKSGEHARVTCEQDGRRRIKGKLKKDKALFLVVQPQKRNYPHEPQAADFLVTDKEGNFETRSLRPGRYQLTFSDGAKAADGAPGRRIGLVQPASAEWSQSFRIEVPKADAEIAWSLPPKDDRMFRIQQIMDTNGQMNVSYSYGDVQASQVGSTLEEREFLLQLLNDGKVPYNWQYTFMKAFTPPSNKTRLADQSIARGLLKLLSETKDRQFRSQIFMTLSTSTVLKEEIAEAMMAMKGNDNYRERWSAAWVLGVMVTEKNRDRVVSALIKSLNDPYPRVREEVAARLGRIKVKEAVEALQRVRADDESGRVKVLAAHALFQITGDEKQAIQAYTRRLRSDKYLGQREAASFLAEHKKLPKLTNQALLAKAKLVEQKTQSNVDRSHARSLKRTAIATLNKVSPAWLPSEFRPIEKKRRSSSRNNR